MFGFASWAVACCTCPYFSLAVYCSTALHLFNYTCSIMHSMNLQAHLTLHLPECFFFYFVWYSKQMLLDCNTMSCDLLLCLLKCLTILHCRSWTLTTASDWRAPLGGSRHVTSSSLSPWGKSKVSSDLHPSHPHLLPVTINQLQLSHYSRRIITLLMQYHPPTILCTCAQVARSRSCNLSWRSCPASSCSTCAPGGSSRSSSSSSSRLPRPSTLHSSDLRRSTCCAGPSVDSAGALW